MKAIRHPAIRTSHTGCAVCDTHSRPVYVPWHQHAVGCSVRAAELQRRQLQMSPPLGAATGVGAF
jgi:hypothetical protein